ncbi:YHYH domain-containing protein [Neobacillus sp. PS3-40]|uniref:YHYH domain-containing protein n=1 Tax=Neobacillus sp. PS3-40 TaxID=3070679 RepID=UPI0035A87A41
MNKFFLLGLALLLLLQVSYVEAHPGRTDTNGGHYCWTNCQSFGLTYGEYHTHKTNSGTGAYFPDTTTQKQVGYDLPVGKIFLLGIGILFIYLIVRGASGSKKEEKAISINPFENSLRGVKIERVKWQKKDRFSPPDPKYGSLKKLRI